MLPDRVLKLKEIVFHEKLGSQYERVQRVWRLAREIAPLVGADPDLAERAAILAKADLVSVMVGEFPELQGVMGRYYALDQEENPSVADAIAAHYKPLGPSDDVPREPVAIAVALADKLDMLVGFWAIDEKPTGSKDPYALRRAALGVIRIVLANGVRFPLWNLFASATSNYTQQRNEFVRAGVERLAGPGKKGKSVGDTLERIANAFGASDAQDFFERAQSASPRAGRAARSRRCRVRSRRRRPLDDRPARRGARPLPRYRGRREPPHRHQARHQHPAHRGEEGRYDSTISRPIPSSSNESRKRPSPRLSMRSRRLPLLPSRARISRRPWPRWLSSASRSMSSSIMSR